MFSQALKAEARDIQYQFIEVIKVALVGSLANLCHMAYLLNSVYQKFHLTPSYNWYLEIRCDSAGLYFILLVSLL